MKEQHEARYSYDGISRVIHEKARLSIMTSLLVHKNGLSFQELKDFCQLSDGNLSRHARILEDAGFIRVEKGFEGRRPKTDYTMTEKGKTEFLRYLGELEKIIRDAHGEEEAGAESGDPEMTMG